MAGIRANSVSVTMTTDSADNTNVGYQTAEQIALSTNPAGASYVWALAKPSASGARAALSLSTSATPTFTPDVEGYYVITCTVDSTTLYILRISVAQVATINTSSALRMMPVTNAQIPTPATGRSIFESTDAGGLAAKNSAGRVIPTSPGIIGANLGDADDTLTVAQGVHRALPIATLTAARAYTLGTSGATAGDVIEIHRYDITANAVTVVNGGGGGGTLTTLTAAEKRSASFRFDGTNWALGERRKLA